MLSKLYAYKTKSAFEFKRLSEGVLNLKKKKKKNARESKDFRPTQKTLTQYPATKVL